jgi:uncharacterized UPF0146 family protein
MRPYKRIERCIALYIAPRYRRAVEIGVGANFEVARALIAEGIEVTCMDIHPQTPPLPGIRFVRDDIFHPAESLYRETDLIYSVRPGLEMIPPMVDLARCRDTDLLVYHLGNELCGRGGEVIECGVPLHRYHASQTKQSLKYNAGDPVQNRVD